jgi:hypothetical protein
MSLRSLDARHWQGARGEARGAVLALALAALGVAAMQAFGVLTNAGLLLVGAAMVLAVVALKNGLRTLSRGWWVATTVIVALTNLLYPRLGGPFGAHPGAEVLLALGLAAAGGVACVLRPGRAAMALLGAAFLCVLAMMALAWTWGTDSIDVFSSLTGATGALLHGANPYGPVFSFRIPAYPWYMPGHFPYGPVVPMLAALGWLAGDVRVMSVVALAVTFVGLWLLARQGSHRLDAHRVVALAIASPFNVGMVIRSWMEVYILAGVIMWLALRANRRRLAIVFLAVAMLVDPVTALLVLPAFIWSRRARFEVVVAALASAIVILPFALITGVGHLVYDIVGIQLTIGPWPSSLTVTAFVWQTWHVVAPSLMAVVAVLIGIALVGWRGRPAHLGEVAVQAALIFLCAFVFGKFANFNQYYVGAAMLVTGLAGVGVAFPAGDVALPSVHELRLLLPWRGTSDPLPSHRGGLSALSSPASESLRRRHLRQRVAIVTPARLTRQPPAGYAPPSR